MSKPKKIALVSERLPLSTQTGGWVNPIHFGLETQNTLRTWLDFSQIGRLQHVAEMAIWVIGEDQDDPTLGEQRRVLEKASELATALATLLKQAPSTAEAELDLVFQTLGYQKQNMVNDLELLSTGIFASLRELPMQDRRKSHAHFAGLIAAVINDAGIKPSVSENSRFYKICQCVFDAVGIYQSPAAAIRVYKSNEP